MNQLQPNAWVDPVSPDEIVDFIKKQNVSEESATGIKLLRRAAETIAWLQSDAYQNADHAGESTQLVQIATALGLEDDSLDNVLNQIEALAHQRDMYLDSIHERDAIIQKNEEELQASRMQQFMPDDSEIEPPKSQNLALQEAEKFGFALIGLSYQNNLPLWVVHGAQGIIGYSQSN